jgi:hypothetical protein
VLFSPGDELFGTVTELAAPDTKDAERTGICWIAKENDQPKFLLARGAGISSVEPLFELLHDLENIASPQEIASEFEVL